MIKSVTEPGSNSFPLEAKNPWVFHSIVTTFQYNVFDSVERSPMAEPKGSGEKTKALWKK